MKDEKKEEDTKEEFCAPCLAVPLAFGGAGGAAFSETISNPKTKNWILGISIVVFLISVAIFIYFRVRCKTCK